MAQVVTSTVTITVSKLVKGAMPEDALISQEIASSLEELVSEMLGDPSLVVEVTLGE